MGGSSIVFRTECGPGTFLSVRFDLVLPCGRRCCVSCVNSASKCTHRKISDDLIDALDIFTAVCTPINCPEHHKQVHFEPQAPQPAAGGIFKPLNPEDFDSFSPPNSFPQQLERDSEGFVLNSLTYPKQCECNAHGFVTTIVTLYDVFQVSKVSLTHSSCLRDHRRGEKINSLETFGAIPVSGNKLFTAPLAIWCVKSRSTDANCARLISNNHAALSVFYSLK